MLDMLATGHRSSPGVFGLCRNQGRILDAKEKGQILVGTGRGFDRRRGAIEAHTGRLVGHVERDQIGHGQSARWLAGSFCLSVFSQRALFSSSATTPPGRGYISWSQASGRQRFRVKTPAGATVSRVLLGRIGGLLGISQSDAAPAPAAAAASRNGQNRLRADPVEMVPSADPLEGGKGRGNEWSWDREFSGLAPVSLPPSCLLLLRRGSRALDATTATFTCWIRPLTWPLTFRRHGALSSIAHWINEVTFLAFPIPLSFSLHAGLAGQSINPFRGGGGEGRIISWSCCLGSYCRGCQVSRGIRAVVVMCRQVSAVSPGCTRARGLGGSFIGPVIGRPIELGNPS